MARKRRGASDRDGNRAGTTSTQDRVEELAVATKDYAIEQILGPVRGAGRWLMFGIAGACAMGIGLLFGLLATLRLMQDLGGDVLDGPWSFVPYLVTAVCAAPAIGYSLSRINTEPLAKNFDRDGSGPRHGGK